MIPDWSGWPVYVVAAGQTAAQVAPDIPQGRCKVIAVNRSYELVPWADILYAADTGFWTHYRGARAFAGLKLCSQFSLAVPSVQPVILARGDNGLRENRMIREPVGTIGAGGHSGFQALNLAVQTNGNPICLVGFDLCGKHWHPDHATYLRNPADYNLRQWARTLDNQADLLASWGVRVINLSPRSALTRFENGHGRLPYPALAPLPSRRLPPGLDAAGISSLLQPPAENHT